MSEPALIPPLGGEVVTDSPERRLEILSEHDDLHATWSRVGPRREGADLHVHRHHADVFYVLDGELTIRLGVDDEQVAVPVGTLAVVPPLVVHGFRNASDADVAYLNLHAPGMRFADYLRALRDGRAFSYDQEEPPADGGRPTTEALLGVASVEVDAVGISVASFAPQEPAAAPQVPARHRRSFYVLEGELALTFAGRELRAAAGSWVQVPAGVAPAVAAAGSEPVRFLDVRTQP
ncbi:MAG TPA: cupin domain-containing protein [Solirubrobacteraceae bacterium]